MKTIKNNTYDQERSLYALKDAIVDNCKFEGKADGESPIKESKNVKVSNCLFNLRYPFCHDDGINITSTPLTNLSRAALWYSKNVKINKANLFGIKALRECKNVVINNSIIDSPEFGW